MQRATSRLPTISSAPRLLWRRSLSTSISRDASYGFVGLGRMGYPMARNLRSKIPQGDSLVVYDVNGQSTKSFKDEIGEGVEIARDLRHVVEQCDTIITMLPEPSHVTSVFTTFLSNPKTPTKPDQQKLFIDSSTIDVSTSLSVSRLVESSAMNAKFVDAPVSGGVVGARAGTLSFLLGASEETLARAKTVVSLMGSKVHHCGGPGAGLAAKLTNNYLLAISNIAVSEAMNMGLKLGLDKDTLKSVINSSTGRCWSSEVNNPLDNEVKGFEGGFGVPLMHKDLKLAQKAAVEVGAKLELGEKAEAIYREVSAQEGLKDFSVVYRWLRER